jgi:hypothetical protein
MSSMRDRWREHQPPAAPMPVSTRYLVQSPFCSTTFTVHAQPTLRDRGLVAGYDNNGCDEVTARPQLPLLIYHARTLVGAQCMRF